MDKLRSSKMHVETENHQSFCLCEGKGESCGSLEVCVERIENGFVLQTTLAKFEQQIKFRMKFEISCRGDECESLIGESFVEG
jgi:hypothetical protein